MNRPEITLRRPLPPHAPFLWIAFGSFFAQLGFRMFIAGDYTLIFLEEPKLRGLTLLPFWILAAGFVWIAMFFLVLAFDYLMGFARKSLTPDGLRVANHPPVPWHKLKELRERHPRWSHEAPSVELHFQEPSATFMAMLRPIIFMLDHRIGPHLFHGPKLPPDAISTIKGFADAAGAEYEHTTYLGVFGGNRIDSTD